MLEGQQNSGSNSGAQMHRALIAAVLGLLLLLVSFAGAAVAGGEPTADSPGPLVASTPTSQSELDALLNGGQPGATDPQTDPNAADDLPHSDLNRAEAEELLVSVFPTVTEDAAGIFSDLQIESFHSDYAAVVPPPSAGESAGLLTSTLPLRAETADGTKRVVDLSLDQTAEGRLRPENPIVDVTLPAEVDDQFRLPEAEVGIELVGPPEDRAASVIEGEAAFYPNVADDTDLLVTPTPTGFETFTQLRSSSAPLIHRFRLSVPQGAALVASDDGGATVLKGGDPLVVVKPPTAFDAAGEPVPVTLHVDANMVELEANPAPDAAYPILVDPLWENYSWKDTNSNAGIGTDWRSYVTPNQSLFTANWVGVLSEKPYAGLALRSYPGSISPGTSSNFNYYVPRYFTDATRPTTFIRNMKLSQVYYVVEENPSAGQPYVISGIWDEKNGIFHSSKTRYATEGAWSNVSLEFPNTQENTGVKNGGIALASYNSAAFKRQVFVGQASVEITENEPPAWGYLPNPGIWTHNSSATAPLDYAVSDAGLGISYVKVTRPEASGGSKDVWTSYQCAGSASNPCPATAETATRAITYDPGAMAQGESTLSVVAQDPVGNQSAPKLVKVKVDHDKPTADLSGNLTEQSSVGTKLAKYTLNYTAKDGDDAAAAALVPVGTVGTGTGQIERPFGIDADNAGNIWISDTTNNRVVELDKNGAYVRQITSAGGVPLKEVRGLTVAPNG
ncbi:MAG TPA: hypothetical protein VFN18_10510, partial [Solirubrobacterales bacterium]|nr:hypothetical protein [Solirubrobacterales bacterium]